MERSDSNNGRCPSSSLPDSPCSNSRDISVISPSAQSSTVGLSGRSRRRTVAEHSTRHSTRRTSERRSTHTQRTTAADRPHKSPVSSQSTEKDSTADCRRSGQCVQCLRVLSLTAAGLLHSHGPGCSGSGKQPVVGSVTCVTLHSQRIVQSSTAATNCSSASPIRTSVDIMEQLRHRRVRVLKRVPKSSRIPAAEKLGETLRQVIDNPDCVDKWIDLLLFTFSCFGVPGQRGGKRHISSLASKINAAVASFPSTSPSVRHPPQPAKLSHSPDNMAERVSSKLEEGDIRGAIRLAASEDTMAPYDDVTVAALRTKHPARATSETLPPTPNSDFRRDTSELSADIDAVN